MWKRILKMRKEMNLDGIANSQALAEMGYSGLKSTFCFLSHVNLINKFRLKIMGECVTKILGHWKLTIKLGRVS